MARLLRVDPNDAVTDVLPAKPGRIPSPETRVEHQVESQPLAGAEGPPRLKLRDLILCPRMEAIPVIGAGHQLDATGRVRSQVLAVNRPAEEPAHGLEPVVGSVRLGLPAIHALRNGPLVDGVRPLGASRLNQSSQQTVPLCPGRG
ncbi:hypothetical protein [Methylobacterium sp. A54F]